jgi:hypothetical protein
MMALFTAAIVTALALPLVVLIADSSEFADSRLWRILHNVAVCGGAMLLVAAPTLATLFVVRLLMHFWLGV